MGWPVLLLCQIAAAIGASQVLVLVVVSMFLAVGLNPMVERLMRRGLGRRLAVLVVTLGVLL